MSSNNQDNDESSNDRSNSGQLQAICYPSDNGSSSPQFSQPRQPRNLQDLLRYSTEVTASSERNRDSSSSTALPLDDESKKFLQEALNSMTVDVVGELMKSIKTLQKVNDLFENSEDIAECEAALDHLLEFVDNLDVANDFFKIGGFTVLKPCLDSAIGGIRWRGAELVADLCQNNPFCQSKISSIKILPTLLNMIDSDVNNICKVKALYAVSCLIRDNDEALEEFSQNDGYSVLLRALQSKIGKLNVKSAFLLSALCSQKPEIKDELVKMGYVEQMIGQLAVFMQIESDERTETAEHLLSALLNLIQDHEESQALCRDPEYQFKEIMSCIIEDATGRDDRMEEFEYAHTLMRLVFKEEECNPVEDR